jgi:hypothetical protein
MRSVPQFSGACSALVLLASLAAHGQAQPDFTQAQAMLDLLRSCRAGKASVADIEHVVSLAGTKLVVEQQNISRSVTMKQYRDVLQTACAGKIAEVKPAEPGVRAEKGVAGLMHDVAPSLIWGRDHVAVLEARLAELHDNQEIGNAVPLARKYLPPALHPEQISLKPKLYVVMGGRAGAAAIDDQLYFDVLISAYRTSQGTLPPLSSRQVVEFFAHETHHLGYGQILDQKRDSLSLTPAQRRAWDFLVALMMEGSATFLINGHERLDDLEKEADIAPYLAKVSELLPAMQTLLRRSWDEPITDEAYAEATDPFLNMGYHATGAVLLAAIEKTRGLGEVMEVMADPRRLLTTYNECASGSTVPFKFDPDLAAQIAHIGDPNLR